MYKYCVPSKRKDVSVTKFNMITRMYETKTLVKHIPYNCKCKFNSKTCRSNQKWNNETGQCQFKKYCTCKKEAFIRKASI